MMKSEPPRTDVARVRRTLLFWLGGGAVVLGILSVVILQLHRADMQSALEDKLAELEAAGLPVRLEEVNRRYHEHGRDPAGNASEIYDQAFSRMVIDQASMDELAKASRNGNEYRALGVETLEIIGEVVAANQNALKLLKEAAAKSYLRADLDLTEGPVMIAPHLGKLREGGRLLAGEAIVAAEAGDAERALEAILVVFRMAYHLAEEPTMVSQLTRIALESIGMSGLERVLDRMEFTPSALVSLREQLASNEREPRLESAFRTEIALAGFIFTQMDGPWNLILDEEPSLWGKIGFAFYRASGRMAKDHRFHLTQMERMLRVVERPVEERVRHDWLEEDDSGRDSLGRILASILIPTFSRVIESDNRSVMFLRASRIALAAEQYRLEQGRFPSHPQDLVPLYLAEVPTDPYAESDTFRFVLEADTFLVRSDGILERRNSEENLIIQFQLPVR